MPARRTHLVLFASVALVLFAGCGKQIARLSELGDLQRKIGKHYRENGVNVNLNNDVFMTVTFINSGLNSKSEGDRTKRAQETALFVKQIYPSIQKLEEIWVVFLRQQTSYIIVTTSEGMGHYGFDNQARPLPLPDESAYSGFSDRSTKPTAVFSPVRKETDISISRLQLEGDMKEGLAVAPHFVIPGDVTGAGRTGPAPKSVSFDFASYSAKSMFPGETKVVFLSDEEVVYEGRDTFTTSKSADGGYSEFLLLKVPYPAFRRMTSGQNLVVRLGDREFKLTDAQLNALYAMNDHVKAPSSALSNK